MLYIVEIYTVDGYFYCWRCVILLNDVKFSS